MAEDTADDLSSFLKSQRQNAAPCWCETAPDEITLQVDAALAKAEEENSAPQWTAIGRWLAKQLGTQTISKNGIQKHKERGHVVG